MFFKAGVILAVLCINCSAQRWPTILGMIDCDEFFGRDLVIVMSGSHLPFKIPCMMTT